MKSKDNVLAVFDDHAEAEAAVETLVAAHFPMNDLSVVGEGYEEQAASARVYDVGDRMVFWGSCGALWGGLGGLLLAAVLLTISIDGRFGVRVYFGEILVSVIEGAALLSGFCAICAGLFGLAIPQDNTLDSQTELNAKGFLVMARGETTEVSRARAVLATVTPAVYRRPFQRTLERHTAA